MQFNNKMEFARFCRACLSEVNQACEIERNPEKPELPLLLKRYVPEFDIKVENACLCFDCASLLYTFHNFKRKCLRTEEDLRLHIRKHPEVEALNLNDIFAPKEQTIVIKKETFEHPSEAITNSTVIPIELIKIERVEPVFDVVKQAISRSFLESKETPNQRKRYQCDKCNRDFEKRDKKYYQHLAYHEKPDADRYMCKICNIVYHSSGALSQHKVRSHSSEVQKLFQCSLCPKKFVIKWSLTLHLRKHACKYKCSLCEFASNVKTELDTHVSARHVTSAPNYERKCYQCDKCSRSFNKKDKVYFEHLAYHQKPDASRYRCKECNFVYQSFGALRQHNTSSHLTDEQKPFQCVVCTKRFVEKWSLTVHMRCHTGKNFYKYKCSLCNKYATNVQYRLDRHISARHTTSTSHKQERYQCDKCSRKFVLKNEYYKHLAYHKKPNAGRYTCKICNFVYTAWKALNKHKINRHSSDDQRKTIKEETTTATAKFTCEICSRSFSWEQSLRVHKLKYHKRERYQCDKCSRSFALKNIYHVHLAYHRKPSANRFVCKICNFVYQSLNALDKHKICKHSSDDQKRFQCKLCARRFVEKSRLIVHMRTHTGEKPYKCPLCKYATGHLGSIYRHVSLKHNVEVERKFDRGKSVIVQKV